MHLLLLSAASALVLFGPCVVALTSASESAAERVACGEPLYTFRPADLPGVE